MDKSIAVLTFCFWLYWRTGEAEILKKEYCVVGAGPGGLQIGYFLQKANRDYLLFDRADRAGSFFIRNPRHRILISINKRFTGRANKEFNLRHDWNSLLSDDDSLLFTKYSTDYFPHADAYLEYLNDFQKKLGIKVQFNTEIRNIQFHDVTHQPENPCRFTMDDQNGQEYCCKILIVGNGIDLPVIPEVRGGEFMENYHDMDLEPKNYEGQSILIIGRGNSGMEVAKSLYGVANFIHLVGKSRVRFSWETHYVGDIRAVNNEVLDSYMLKSLDGVFEAGIEEMYVIKREDGKLMVRSTEFDEINFLDQNPVREGYDRIIRCLGYKWDTSLFHSSTVPRKNERPDENLLHEKKSKMDKYPHLDQGFQSVDFPGLFFVGALTHLLDYGKSAGGFIHGYRYTGRVLHRLLEWKYHDVKWPAVDKSYEQLLPSLLKRANEASGLYQMFQFLGDILIINKTSKSFQYLEEFPINLIWDLPERTGHSFNESEHSLLVMTLEYGANFSKVGEDHFGEDRAHGSVDEAHLSNFLHPVFYFYRKLPSEDDLKSRQKSETLPKPDGIHHILEDFTTTFDGPTTHILPLRRFLEVFLEEDLRIFLAESCITFALTSHIEDPANDLPLSCRKYLNSENSVLAYALPKA